MKRIFLIMMAVVMSCVASEATQLSSAQRKAKKEIFNALKKYVSNIQEVDDETLRFRYSERNFLASIHELNPEVLYLTLGASFSLSEEYNNVELANFAAFNSAANKPVCTMADSESLMYSCEMYARDAKPFIAVLPEMLQAIYSSSEAFPEEYEKLEAQQPASTLAASSSSSATETIADNYQFIYPKFESTNDGSHIWIEKVTLTADQTILDMVSYNGGNFRNCTMNRDAYLMSQGRKYPLTKAEGITYYPEYTDYPFYESGYNVCLRFRLYFPRLANATASFSFYEAPNDGWQIKDVELKHGKTLAIQGERLETMVHSWECVGLELQDGQTILTKLVKPKSENTFMYSSQDQYIEDAETGRKYYLTMSSIGFEGAPTIATTADPRTFYEIYPALPPTVKRINIHSGQDYYVKNLQIR